MPRLNLDMVTIPAGEFLMGSDKRRDSMAYDGETPQHRVYLPEYRIARVPVTNRQYKLFVDATGYEAPGHWESGRIPDSKENHPVANVTWRDAQAFCRWAGVRLPNEAQWEKAARGTDGRIWPWGNKPPNDKLCNFNNNVGRTTPVGAYPVGASPDGCLDMAGNVWEWTSSKWGMDGEKPEFGYPYDPTDGREDPEGDARRVLRGGAFDSNGDGVRCASRSRFHPYDWVSHVGFRVVVVVSPFTSGL